MSARNRKLVKFNAEQGGAAGEQQPRDGKQSSVTPEQMRRTEEQLADTHDAAARQPRAEPTVNERKQRRAAG